MVGHNLGRDGKVIRHASPKIGNESFDQGYDKEFWVGIFALLVWTSITLVATLALVAWYLGLLVSP